MTNQHDNSTQASMSLGTDDKMDFRQCVLGEDNWCTWQWQIKKLLNLKGLSGCITGEESDERKNDQATVLLASSLSTQNMQRVINCETAKDIWTALEATFENKSSTERYMLMEQLLAYKIRTIKDISKSIGEVQYLAARLKSLGAKSIDDELIINVILKGLPNSLENWKATWGMVNAKNRNLNELITALHAEVSTMKAPENAAYVAQSSSWARKPGGARLPQNKESWKQRNNKRTDRKSTTECFYCGIKGHWARDCRKRESDQRQNRSSSKQEHHGVAMMAISDREFGDMESWIADSGSSFHMTPKLDWIQDYKLFEVPRNIILGDNHRIAALGRGLIKTSFGMMHDVHYVPELSTNLFSISAATNKGIEARYTNEGIQLIKNGKIVLAGDKSEGIYSLKFKVEIDEAKAYSAISLEDWHHRFGHTSKDIIRKMAELKVVDDLLISNLEGTPEKCTDCALGKCQRVSHPSKSTPRATKPGLALHFDTAGPYRQESLSGGKYLLLCKDEASGYRIGKIISSKADIPCEVKKIISETELETGNNVRPSDNGTEFVNNDIKQFLDDKGINHHTSVPYTPQQNGFIERDIRTIMETARTTHQYSGLPRYLWSEAVMTVIYVLNRSLNSTNTIKTPYELWFGRRPSVKNLHRFGQKAVVKYRDYERSKWDNKGCVQFFVGYTKSFNTFRFFDPDTELVYKSCDVMFIDNNDKETKDNDKQVGLKDDSEPEEWISVEGSDRRQPDESDNPAVQNTVEIADLEWDSETELFSEGKDKNTTVIHRDKPSTSTPKTTQESGENVVTEKIFIRPPGKVHRSKTPEERKTITDVQPRKYTRKDKVKQLTDRLAPSDIHLGHIKTTRLRSKDRSHAKIATLETEDDPKIYKEAISRPDKEKWELAMQDEIDSLMKNEVYELVDRPTGNIVTNKWVYKIKRNPKGEIERYKARLVARGFTQAYGVDYFETYAPVADMVSIRMIFAYAAMKKLEMAQFDIKTAFLYGDLEETVYMEQPDGFILDDNKVCLLKKSLYGLKQSPRQWNLKFSNYLKDMNLKESEHDKCVFYRLKPLLVIVIYVDDGLVFAENKEDIDLVIKSLSNKFEVHLMESNTFLGFQVDKGKSGEIILHQTNYISKILHRFDMHTSKPVDSPISLPEKLDNNEPLEHDNRYREAIGSLMYAAVNTRLDIAYAVNKASRNVENPTQDDWMAVKRIFRYLREKEGYALVYRPTSNTELTVYCDADFAGDTKTSRSTTGAVFILGEGPIQWKSKRQTLITLSSTEAEFVSLCSTVKETIWIRKLGMELGMLEDKPTIIYCDNQSAIRIATNERSVHRTRHMSVQAGYPREQIDKGVIDVKHVTADDQLADMLTKPTTTKKFLTNTGRLMTTILKCLCLTFLLTAGISSVSSSYVFERVNPMIWIPIEQNVEISATTVHLELTYTSPCETFLKKRFPLSMINLEKKDNDMLEGIKELCITLYKDQWMKKLDQFIETKPPKAEEGNTGLDKTKTGLTRRKRFDPFTLIFAGTALVVCVLYNLVASAVSEVVPWGDGYRIKTLQNQREEDYKRLNKFEDELNQDHVLLKALETRLNTIDQTIIEHTMQINHLYEAIPRLIFWGSHIQSVILEAGNKLDRIIHAYSMGQAATFEMTHLWNLTSIFDGVQQQDTTIQEVKRLSKATVYMKILIKNKSKDTNAFQIVTFNYKDNLTGIQYQRVYKGGEFMIFNRTSKCIKVIRDPRGKSIHDHCILANYKDPKIGPTMWEKQPINETNYKPLPVAERAATYNYIYCYEYNITIDDQEHICPTYPFRLPVSIGFTTKGIHHTAVNYTAHGSGPEWNINLQIPQTLLPENKLSEVELLDSLQKMRQKLEPENNWINEFGFTNIIILTISITVAFVALVCILIQHIQQQTRNITRTRQRESERQRRRPLISAPQTIVHQILSPNMGRRHQRTPEETELSNESHTYETP